MIDFGFGVLAFLRSVHDRLRFWGAGLSPISA
jgi:hypothetical protein